MMTIVRKLHTFRRFGLPGLLLLFFIVLLVGQHLVRGGDPSLEFNAPGSLPPSSATERTVPLPRSS